MAGNPKIPAIHRLGVWLIFLLLTLCAQGCQENDGYQWIEVTPESQLNDGPRQFTFEFPTAHWFDINCASNNRSCVAVGQDGRIKRSEDGGKSWGVGILGLLPDLLAMHGKGNRLVAVGSDGAIAHSEDAGKTWSSVVSGTSKELLAVHGVGDQLVAVGSGGTIVRSEDAGKTWSVVASGTVDALFALHGIGNRLVAVGRAGEIVRSEDAGKTWAIASASSDPSINLSAVEGADNWLVAVGSRGKIVRSEDAGKTWVEVASGTKYDLNALYCIGDQLIAVGIGGVVVRSEDTGRTWSVVFSGTQSALVAVHGVGERLVAIGNYGVIVYSENAGKTWAVVPSGAGSSLLGVHSVDRRLVAVGDDGEIIRSEDAGQTWSLAFSDPFKILRAVHAVGERMVAVGDNGTIVLMTANGILWPTLAKFGHRSALGPQGLLLLRFVINDHDQFCQQEKNCTLEIVGRNEADFLSKRPSISIAVKQVGKAWEASVNPKDFNMHSGETLHIEAVLKGANFSMHYPVDQPAFSIPYQVDPRPFYVAISLGTLASMIAFIYWFRPLWLLAIYRRVGIFEAVQKLNIPGLSEGLQIALKLTVLPWLISRPRVLDAWLTQNLDAFSTVFDQEEAVARLHYYPLPLRRGTTQETVQTPSPEDFAADFSARHMLLQILGAGGSGKTSLAAQLGRWALDRRLMEHLAVPIWLDSDIADVRKWLTQRVKEIARDDELPVSFIQALFKTKRLLFIVDRLSERTAASREAFKHLPDWLAVVIFTARYKIELKSSDLKYIETLGLDSRTVMGFIETLIQHSDESQKLMSLNSKASLVNEFAKVITVSNKEERITPLLVSLFVQIKLAQIAASPSEEPQFIPTNIPEIYFEYLNRVNPSDQAVPNYLPKEKLLRVAGLLACLELGDDFRPKRIDRHEVEKALAKENLLADGMNPLQRLIDNQVLEQRREGSDYLIAFTLDPVAEYLAAFAHGKRCSKSADAWQKLIADVDAQGKQANGFLTALRITHQIYSSTYEWPAISFPELAEED